MTFTIDPAGDLTAEVRAIARDQTCKAIADLEQRTNIVEAVHDCRKRCKKIRGLVRMVRPGLGDDYERANKTVRDGARLLSPLRDAHALSATFAELVTSGGDIVDPDDVESVVEEFEYRADVAVRSPEAVRTACDEASELLYFARDQIDDWVIDDGWDAVWEGVAKTYQRGREALASVDECPTAERLHDYRKRTKYTWYHIRLLEDVAPAVLQPMDDSFHTLSGLLGDDHDLSIIADDLAADPDAFGGDEPVRLARHLVAGRRDELQRRALRLGRQLHAESTEAFVDRLGALHRAWRADVAA